VKGRKKKREAAETSKEKIGLLVLSNVT